MSDGEQNLDSTPTVVVVKREDDISLHHFKETVQADPTSARRTIEGESCEKGILLVEDNDINRKLGKKFLVGQNNQWLGKQIAIIGAVNGLQCVEMMHLFGAHADLILMDVTTPVMGGIEANKKLRRDGFVDVPIIALTGNLC